MVQDTQLRSWCKLRLISCNQLTDPYWSIQHDRSLPERNSAKSIALCFLDFQVCLKKTPSSNMPVSCYSRVWLTASRRASRSIEGWAVMDRPDRGDWPRSFAECGYSYSSLAVRLLAEFCCRATRHFVPGEREHYLLALALFAFWVISWQIRWKLRFSTCLRKIMRDSSKVNMN